MFTTVMVALKRPVVSVLIAVSFTTAMVALKIVISHL